MKNIYIHIPFCLKKCLYCSFAIHAVGTKNQNLSHLKDNLEIQYLAYLQKEMEVQFSILQPGDSLDTLYFGGGTPSLLSEEGFSTIFRMVGKWFPKYSQDYECTIECDPGTFDQQKLDFLHSEGVNRVSLGVQTFDNEILQKLNRSHNLDQTFRSIGILQNSQYFADLQRVSMDLLINTPFSNKENVQESLDQILKIKPGHISVYSLQMDPGSYFYDKLKYREGVHPCPMPSIQQEQYSQVHSSLMKGGYDHYEVSNYCRDVQTQSKHNLMYWRGDKPFYGFGMGASSLHHGLRINRPRTLKKYFGFVDYFEQYKNYPIECVEDETSEEERIKVILMGRMRTKYGFSLNQLNSRVYESKIRTYLNNNKGTLSHYINYQIYDKEDRLVVLVPDGYLVCDELVSQFLY